MKIEPTPLKDCFVVHDTVFKDERGYFFESFNKRRFKEKTNLDVEFVQDNQSRSSKGVLRGLHFQKNEFAQSKLVRVLEGIIYDVVVDLRINSETFGQSFTIELTAESHKQLFIPRGFAHGFQVLSDTCVFFYKCDNYYHKTAEMGILYNDPTLKIEWPINENLIISEKDRHNPSLSEIINQL